MRAYLSHPIMGKKGLNASEQYMEENNAAAIRVADGIESVFPGLDIYVPAKHEDFVAKAYTKKYISLDQILDIDCDIVSDCDFLIAYAPEQYISSGMRREIDHANHRGIPVIMIYDWSADAMNAIGRFLEGVKR